jgi:hypothetical protein
MALTYVSGGIPEGINKIIWFYKRAFRDYFSLNASIQIILIVNILLFAKRSWVVEQLIIFNKINPGTTICNRIYRYLSMPIFFLLS